MHHVPETGGLEKVGPKEIQEEVQEQNLGDGARENLGRVEALGAQKPFDVPRPVPDDQSQWSMISLMYILKDFSERLTVAAVFNACETRLYGFAFRREGGLGLSPRA